MISGKYDKFKQINRFLELVEDKLKKFPNKDTLSIVDFGCGKAYLTFALYYWLHEIKRKNVHILGLDLKKEVVEFCQKTAVELGFQGLEFQRGSIENTNLESHVDMVVTLHACNTATDAALAKAIEWNAEIILSVPCCQHELYSQIECPLLNPLLKHGVLKNVLLPLSPMLLVRSYWKRWGIK